MKIDSFDRLYIFELRNAYSTEKQLVKALSQMEKSASDSELKEAFKEHCEETKTHVQRLEKIFESLEMSPGDEDCEAVEGLIEDAERIIDDHNIPSELKDAALIAAVQKTEHYEMAVYGTLTHYAKTLGRDEDVELLNKTLEEEKEADKKLNTIAINRVNKEAIEESSEHRQNGMDESRPSP